MNSIPKLVFSQFSSEFETELQMDGERSRSSTTEREVINTALVSIGFCSIFLVICAIWKFENDRQKRHPGIWRDLTRRAQDLNMSTKDRLFYVLWGINLAVFLAWHKHGWEQFLITYFASGPSSSNHGSSCMALILSVFSHIKLYHFALNMAGLYQHIGPLMAVMGPEQFLAFYLSGGVVANFFSRAFKIALGETGKSVGASGALFAMMGFHASLDSNSRYQESLYQNVADCSDNFILIFRACYCQWSNFHLDQL